MDTAVLSTAVQSDAHEREGADTVQKVNGYRFHTCTIMLLRPKAFVTLLACQVNPIIAGGVPRGITAHMSTAALQRVWVDAGLASREILAAFREAGTVATLKALQRQKGPAYSMASFSTGSMLQLMGGVRALFKSLYTTEIDKQFKAAINNFTGVKCLGNTFKQDYSKHHSVVLVSMTTEYPDYASGATNVKLNLKYGCDGDKGGWQFVLSVQPVLQLQALIVEYEMVANALEVHDGAEVIFVASTYKKAGYQVLAAKVTIQQCAVCIWGYANCIQDSGQVHGDEKRLHVVYGHAGVVSSISSGQQEASGALLGSHETRWRGRACHHKNPAWELGGGDALGVRGGGAEGMGGLR